MSYGPAARNPCSPYVIIFFSFVQGWTLSQLPSWEVIGDYHWDAIFNVVNRVDRPISAWVQLGVGIGSIDNDLSRATL